MYPKRSEALEEYKQSVKDEIAEALKKAESDDKHAPFRIQAEKFREMDKANNGDQKDLEETKEDKPAATQIEEKKDEEVVKKNTKDDIIKKVIESETWLESLKDKKSLAHKLNKDATFIFNKFQTDFLTCIKLLLGSEENITAERLLGPDSEMVFARLLQNALHPKNNVRVEAIKNGTYKEFKKIEDAREWLIDMLRQNLDLEMKGIESALHAENAKLLANQSCQLTMTAPDGYIAAAVLHQESIFNGKGDRSAFI